MPLASRDAITARIPDPSFAALCPSRSRAGRRICTGPSMAGLSLNRGISLPTTTRRRKRGSIAEINRAISLFPAISSAAIARLAPYSTAGTIVAPARCHGLRRNATEPFCMASPSGSATIHSTIVNAIDHGVCVIEMVYDAAGRAVDYRFVEVNPAFARQTGLDDAVGRTMRSIRPDHEEHWFAIYGRVAKTGEPIRFENRAAALGRWYDVFAFPIGDPSQHRVAVVFNDITQRKQTEHRMQLVAAELDHRIKNVLTIASSLVRLTTADTVKALKDELLSRFAALSNLQRLLRESPSEVVSLEKLVREEMAIHGAAEGGAAEDRVSWSGPAVTLTAAAQPVVMALHELATNAVKYGALSVPEGRVAIDWRRLDDGRLALRWRERGGPPAERPAKGGLGSAIILSSVGDAMGGGEARFDWGAEGVTCELVFPPGLAPA
ncbi:MAG: PAS domain-containing protein [Rhodospirillales bacterium]|nr:PAS domain-containing protein [Rhodospirillales bacterium]